MCCSCGDSQSLYILKVTTRMFNNDKASHVQVIVVLQRDCECSNVSTGQRENCEGTGKVSHTWALQSMTRLILMCPLRINSHYQDVKCFVKVRSVFEICYMVPLQVNTINVSHFNSKFMKKATRCSEVVWQGDG